MLTTIALIYKPHGWIQPRSPRRTCSLGVCALTKVLSSNRYLRDPGPIHYWLCSSGSEAFSLRARGGHCIARYIVSSIATMGITPTTRSCAMQRLGQQCSGIIKRVEICEHSEVPGTPDRFDHKYTGQIHEDFYNGYPQRTSKRSRWLQYILTSR